MPAPLGGGSGKAVGYHSVSHLEEALRLQLRYLEARPGEQEYRFGAMASGGTGKGLRKRLLDHGLKDWRFDFAWPDLMFAVEVEGGAHIGGRHNRGTGFEEDLTKYHHAMRLGWTVYRCSAPLINSWEAAKLIKALLDDMKNG